MTHLPSDGPLFQILGMMNKVRPFKLVFLLVAPSLPHEEAPQELAGALDSVTAKGLLVFLDSPPTTRSAPFHAQVSPPPRSL